MPEGGGSAIKEHRLRGDSGRAGRRGRDTVPAGRVGMPDEYGPMGAFLASDQAARTSVGQGSSSVGTFAVAAPNQPALGDPAPHRFAERGFELEQADPTPKDWKPSRLNPSRRRVTRQKTACRPGA